MNFEPGKIYSWTDVSIVHKTRNGIYQRYGRLISLLTDFGRINPCYPDVHRTNTDTILYTGAGRRGDQKLDSYNRALLDAAASRVAVPLFNKLSPGTWQYMGEWGVTSGVYVYDGSQARMLWKFTLHRVDTGD
jgi:hypothetical protein